jgi:hypothetical protein
MLSTTLRRWLKKGFRTGLGARAGRRPSFVPRLEALEERASGRRRSATEAR